MSSIPVRTVDDLTLGEGARLDELADRQALREMVASFHELFRVPMRVYDERSGLLADAATTPAVYRYLSEFPNGRQAVDAIISEISLIKPTPPEEITKQCFTGAVYRVAPITLDGRRIGRLVLGPFLPPSVRKVDRRLLQLDPRITLERLKELLAELPRAREETVAQISRHLQRSLDLILFSGQKTLLTTAMHLASVRESFRDLKEKNEQLQSAYDRLKELDRLKSSFLATVSHELRTPLTSIIGYSEMLAQGIAGELLGEQQQFVETIHEKGEQLLEMITGLLDMSKLESGTLSMRKEEVHVGELIQDIVETMTPMAMKKGVRMTVKIAPGLPTLSGDATRLRQVFTNLADNALKFTPENGEILLSVEMTQMRTAPDDTEGLVLLSMEAPAVKAVIADSGIGIADDEKARVFDAFYQVDSGTTRRSGGTGLGLSIVKRLVEAHEGTIEIVDNVPSGAAFVVTLPLRHLSLS
jgi:two-component system, NarL family, sensor histidine kinase BarA